MKMNRLERLLAVQEWVAKGDAYRSIARRIGVDEGTVRHDAKILRLDEQAIARIKAGEPAEPHLRAARQQAIKELLVRRLAEEEQDQRHSTALAKRLAGYLLTEVLTAVEEKQIAARVERRLWEEGPGSIWAAPRRDFARTLKQCIGVLDDKDEMETRFQQYITGITRAMVLLAPERLIRDRALSTLKMLLKKEGRHKPHINFAWGGVRWYEFDWTRYDYKR